MGTIKVKNTDGNWIPIIANKILASNVVLDSTHRFVTDTEKNRWDSNNNGSIDEAPADGNQYTRGSKKWNKINIQDYALKSEIKTKTSELTNDSNFISSIPTEYVTDTELNQKGYLTQHQDISNKADKIKIEQGGTGVITKVLKPNTFYEFGVCTNLDITFASGEVGVYNSYSFEFQSGSSCTLNLPSSVKWVGGKALKINPNKTYQVSILNNLAVGGEF